jgi:hypothetical protein
MANMEGRARVVSNTASFFSHRQFASITDTLIKASQRRDAEMQQRMNNRQTAPAPAVQASHSAPAPSVTPVSEVSRGSESGDSRAELEQVCESSETARDAHSNFNRTCSTSGKFLLHRTSLWTYVLTDCTGIYDPQCWLRMFDTNRIDDVKTMLADRDQTQVNAKDKVDESNDAHHKLAKLERVDSPAKQTAMHPDSDDPRAMLADLESKSQEPFGVDAKDIARYVAGPTQMLAEFDALSALASKLGMDDEEADQVGDPKAMLEEIENLAKTVKQLTTDDVAADDNYDDPKAMLAELDAKTQDSEEDDDDLKALRDRLTTMFSPPRKLASQAFLRTITDTPALEVAHRDGTHHDIAGTLEPGMVPYVVALMLESAGIKWEEVHGWCTFLFSSGMDGYEAKEETDEMVKKEEVKLDALIQQTLEEEKADFAREEKKRLPFRLIVSNLAADIDTDAIRIFFKKFAWDMQVTFTLF